MQSEGVGSYWPFTTGKMVDQANLQLELILNTLSTRFLLIPNQHVGVHEIGFAAQWATREFIARRGGAKFKQEAIKEARCPILGYALSSMKIDGTKIPKAFLQVDKQPEVGEEGYDAGAEILTAFFKREAEKFLTPTLTPLGKQIIEVHMDNGSVADYYSLIPKL
jgi:hypothetical protein